MEVRDPIHGAILVDPPELPVVDHPFLQRLRAIKQMGFSEHSFPGAVHSRFLHSVGVMHLAGQAFDAAFRHHAFSSPELRGAYRQAVRLAALLHDVGHAPFSHCTEFAMPPLRELPIGRPGAGVYHPEVLARRGALRASHEDYTINIVVDSALSQVIAANFPFSPRHVAALISREVVVQDDFFQDRGLDYREVLSQFVSSELDVDRLDYLGRDSYFSGVRYGLVDLNWLLNNLSVHEREGRVSLALDRRAIYAFDDFMVARYHMFVMVYFHHKSVVLEEMLKRYLTGQNAAYSLPADMESYLEIDDVHLLAHLRASEDPFAHGISRRQPWTRVLELHGRTEEVDVTPALDRLRERGFDTITASSVGKLSRYTVFGQKRDAAPPIYVLDSWRGEAQPLAEATHIFERYQDERRISRVYVAPEHEHEARELLARR